LQSHVFSTELKLDLGKGGATMLDAAVPGSIAQQRMSNDAVDVD